MKIGEFIKTMPRLKRYLLVRLRYLTLKKIINFIICEYSMYRKKSNLKSYPYEMLIEPTNICNLACPLCFVGSGKVGRKKMYMSIDKFNRVIDDLSPYLFHAFLYHQGEPLFHKKIIEFIRYAHDANIATTICSNLSFALDDALIEDIIKSGLDTIVISIDGTDSETYQQYRVGGDYEKVFKNLSKFVEIKKRLKLKTPHIEWQFIVMKHNEHQIEQAKSLARQIGVDSIAFINALLTHSSYDSEMSEVWLPKNSKYRNRVLLDKSDDLIYGCWWPWRTAIIHCDGNISPCAYTYYDRDDFANYGKSFKHIWNNKHFMAARRFISRNEITPGIELPCSKCSAINHCKTKHLIGDLPE